MQVAPKGIVPLGQSGKLREFADREPARTALTVNVKIRQKCRLKNVVPCKMSNVGT